MEGPEGMELLWRAADGIRTVAEAAGHQVWDLHWVPEAGLFSLELSGHLDEDAAIALCGQFSISADYEGEGSRGSCFSIGPVAELQ